MCEYEYNIGVKNGCEYGCEYGYNMGVKRGLTITSLGRKRDIKKLKI